jgi:N-methylhydantoinase A/oxoprolinase/acetone carboxylase beta subunit
LDSNLQPSGVSDSSSEFREIYDFTKNTFQSAPVFQRSELNSRQILEGPLLIQETDTTIVVPEGFSVTQLAEGHLMLEQK